MQTKKMKDLVKEIQFRQDLTLDDIAKRIGYSPSYFRNAVNKGENEKLRNALLKEFNYEQNVSPEPEIKEQPVTYKKTNGPDYQAKYIALLEKQCEDQSSITEILINLDELQKMVVATALNVRIAQRLIEVVAGASGKKGMAQEASKIADEVSKKYAAMGIESLKDK